MVCLTFFLVWVSGELALGFVGRRGFRRALSEAPLAFGLGWVLLFICWLIFCWSGPVSVGLYWILPLLLAAVRVARRNMNESDHFESVQVWKDEDRLLLTALVAVVVITVVVTCLLPILDWDTRILWALKTKILFKEPTLYAEPFKDPYLLHIHPRYPLMVPWLGSLTSGHQGGFIEQQYQLLISLISALSIWQLYRLVVAHTGRRLAIVLCLVMALTGVWMQANFNSSVEIGLVFFLLLVLEMLERWLVKGGRINLMLAVIFLAGLAMVKNEGLLLALALLLGCFISFYRRGGLAQRGKNFSVLLLGWVLIYSLWLIHMRTIPAVSDENYWQRLNWDNVLAGLSRSEELFLAIAREIFDLSSWHLIWFLPVLIVFNHIRQVRQVATSLFPLTVTATTFFLLGVLCVYLISPWRDLTMHVAVTFDRVMLPVVPLMLIMLGCCFGSYFSRGASDPESRGHP